MVTILRRKIKDSRMDLEQDITNGHPSRKGEGIKSHNAEALTNKKRVHDRKQTNNDKKNGHETDGHEYTVENRALNSALFQKPVNKFTYWKFFISNLDRDTEDCKNHQMPNQVMTDQPSRKRKRGTEERDTAPIGKGMDVPSYGVDILRGCKKTIQSDHIGG